ncbi:hypothetical protein [Demequina sp. NBRC 110053]|uniref:hypothetical protein n=1 Tax=Demequina sp. NBRC 110053 TaxID=1570342 RepID=UPI000A05A2E7|nr:hypothetical protein [Demequina sp. NBRC 110053]
MAVEHAARARSDADSAARRAAVEVRALRAGEVAQAARLLTAIWGNPTIEPPLMVALEHSGAYVAGAFAAGEPDRMVGACVGYFAQPLGQALHSHVAGVAPGTERRGVGMAMKLHQRAWALERGLTRITWTFDPLVSRNAAFNIERLGVDIDEYLVDFYGEMSDGVNAGQGSDRLLAAWRLDKPLPTRPPAASTEAARPDAVARDQTPPHRERHSASASALEPGSSGDPRVRVPDPSAPEIAIAVPPDIEALRRERPESAARWRGAVRGAMVPLLDRGWRVTGFHDHHYLLGRP